MKKVLTLALVLIMGLVIFSGCDNINSPVEPENSEENFNLTSSSCEEGYNNNSKFFVYEENGNGYVVPVGVFPEDIDFTEYVKVNPQYKHYLLDIQNWVENGNIEFYNPKVSIAYLNKINVLIEMCDNGNLKAAENKLENDLRKYSNLWISNEDQKMSLNILFDLTLWMIQNPDSDLIVPPETLAVNVTNELQTRVENGLLYQRNCVVTEYTIGMGNWQVRIFIYRICTQYQLVGIDG